MCERRRIRPKTRAGAAPKGDEAVGANSWRRSRRRNTGTAAAGSGRVRKHLWLKEQTMQRCPRSSSLMARVRCLRARPQMRISSGSSHVNLAHDCWRAMPARRLPHQQLERVAPQASRCGSAAASRARRTKRTRRWPWVYNARLELASAEGSGGRGAERCGSSVSITECILPAPLALCEVVRPRAHSRQLLAPGPQTRPHGSYLAVSPRSGSEARSTWP